MFGKFLRVGTLARKEGRAAGCAFMYSPEVSSVAPEYLADASGCALT
jgi:hypothetical protein